MFLPVTSTTSTMSIVSPAPVPPVPVAAIAITPPATFHPVSIPVSIIVLSGSAGQGQTPDSENHQQTKNDDSL
jgi:hypothetical protein